MATTTGEVRNGRLPPSQAASDLLQAGKAIHDSIWGKTEARINEGISEVKALVESLGQQVGFTIDQAAEEKVRKALEVALKDSLGMVIRQYEEKSLIFTTKAHDLEQQVKGSLTRGVGDLERKVGETLDQGVWNIDRKFGEKLAGIEARADALEKRAMLFEESSKELVVQMVNLVNNIKNIQFAPPIINVMVPEGPAPQITVKAAEIPVTVNIPEQPAPQITLSSPAAKPMVKHITYDDNGRPIEIVEREVESNNQGRK